MPNLRPFKPCATFARKSLAVKAAQDYSSGRMTFRAMTAKDSNIDGRFSIIRVK